MFGRKYRERELRYEARIRELENLLCPGEQHDFNEVDRQILRASSDGFSCIVYRRAVCARCNKVVESTKEEA